MQPQEQEKVMVTEQLFELRHATSGSFLDIRGSIADYVRDSGFLPHWKIDQNVVSFRDTAGKVEKEGAFAGYRSVGYLVYDPGTGNFFPERAARFWKLISKEQDFYRVPQATRFGARTKVFLPTKDGFEALRERLYGTLYSKQVRDSFLGKETDLQFIIELSDEAFDIRVAGGPLKENEAQGHFQFQSGEFLKCGLFLDLDYFRTKEVDSVEVAKYLRSAQAKTWKQVETLATTFGV